MLAYLKGLFAGRRGRKAAAAAGDTRQIKHTGSDVYQWTAAGQWTMWSVCGSFWFHDFGATAWAKISPDGARLLCGGDRSTGLWDATTFWTPIAEFDFPAEESTFSHDSSRALIPRPDGSVGIFDTSSGEQLILLRGRESGNKAPRFSHDDSLVLTIANDMATRLWDAESGEEQAVFPGEGEFDPSGLRLLTKPDRLCLWDCVTKELMWETSASQSSSLVTQFSPDGRFVLLRTSESCRLLDGASGDVRIEWECPGHLYPVLFSPDGKRLLTRSEEGVHLWDPELGKEIATIGEGFECFGDRAGFDGVFSNDSSRVITQGRDFNMFARVSCANTGKEIARLPTGDFSLASSVLSSDGTLALATDNCEVLIMNVDSAKMISRIVDDTQPHRLSMARFCGNDQRVLTLAGFDREGQLVSTNAMSPLSSETMGDRRYVEIWSPD